jgi:hypothetical protein
MINTLHAARFTLQANTAVSYKLQAASQKPKAKSLKQIQIQLRANTALKE